MFISSFWSGTLETGFTFSFSNWTNYPEALSASSEQFVRSILYAAAATLLTFPHRLPIHDRLQGGRYKALLLFLVVAPFFTSFLRTISWKISSPTRACSHHSRRSALPPEFRLLAEPIASSPASRTTSCRS
jgi:hypothetical protein